MEAGLFACMYKNILGKIVIDLYMSRKHLLVILQCGGAKDIYAVPKLRASMCPQLIRQDVLTSAFTMTSMYRGRIQWLRRLSLPPDWAYAQSQLYPLIALGHQAGH